MFGDILEWPEKGTAEKVEALFLATNFLIVRDPIKRAAIYLVLCFLMLKESDRK